MTETQLIERDGWTARLQTPTTGQSGRLLLLLHGWTGDEESMWVIARKIPQDYWILAPRAPYPAEDGGYSWLPPGGGLHSKIVDYLPALESLLNWVKILEEISSANRPFDLVGFSQGAAAAYALSLAWPENVHLLAGLAGFIPGGSEEYSSSLPLQGKQVFISHGRQDERIRIEAGYQAAAVLTRAGAEVDFCAADTGHKLSSDCHRRLVQFLSNESTTPHDRNQTHKYAEGS